MKIKILLLLSVLMITCQVEEETSEEKTNDTTLAKIIQLGERYNELGRFSGTILVAEKGEVLFNQSFGFTNYLDEVPFTDSTPFKIGELSMLYPQVILSNIISAEGIDKEAFISDFIKSDTTSRKISDLVEQSIFQQPYADFLLESLIEKWSDETIDVLLEKLVKDLKLENTYFLGNESLESKGHQYLNQGNGLEWVLSPEYDLEKISIYNGLRSTPLDLLKVTQALDIDTIQFDGYIHNDGFSYALDKASDLTIIILSNVRQPIAKEIVNSIKAILTDTEYELPLQRKEIKVAVETLNKYAGIYQLPSATLKVEVSNDSLFTFFGSNKIHLKAQSETQFFINDADAEMRFVEDENENITGVILFDGFLEGNFIEKIQE